MKKMSVLRPALTMLEVIFVIVILGIVSSIGAEVIAQVYESYIVQRAEYKANIKTELVLNQIANRLRYAIPGTVYAEDGGTMKPITDIGSATSNRLQWVAYDGDSFEAMTSTSRKPGWSGFCDLNASSGSTISTPGSQLDLATEIIGNLGGNIANAVLYFPDGSSHSIRSGTGETLTLDSSLTSGDTIYERYKLAWSSYALSVENGDLYLYYQFPPTPGVNLGGTKSLLLKGISNFRFKGSEGSLRIKICKEEQIGMDNTNTIRACKEKVVF
ncbi:MAG: type II secretion system protein [Sulfurovum sp.]|nr:type II secretion system protein [Sulfurovum sp.]